MIWKWWAEASQDHLACSIASQSQVTLTGTQELLGLVGLQLPGGIQGEHNDILQKSDFACF